MNDVLFYFSIKYGGDFKKIYNAIVEKEKVNPDELKKVKESFPYDYLTIIDSDYPNELKEVNAPPFVIFYKGDKRLFNKKKFFLLNSTNLEMASKEELEEMNNLFENRIDCIVGTVKGYDIRICNDFEQCNEPLVITEYPPNTRRDKREKQLIRGIVNYAVSQFIDLRDDIVMEEYQNLRYEKEIKVFVSNNPFNMHYTLKKLGKFI